MRDNFLLESPCFELQLALQLSKPAVIHTSAAADLAALDEVMEDEAAPEPTDFLY